MLTVALLLACAVPQEPAPLVAKLTPSTAASERGLRWSPKGAKVVLTARDSGLDGSFALGTQDAPPIRVRLEKSAAAVHFDTLRIDADRDGRLGEGEVLTAQPREQRGKWWSSFEATLQVPIAAQDGADATTRDYPVSLWFVFDPVEPDAEPALRWSRRGWHEGTVTIGERQALVLITEFEMDGVFDQRDAWALAWDRGALLSAESRRLEQHVWLDGTAYRALRIDPHGRELAFEAFDPGFTEAEERARNDRYAADRSAPRAAAPIAFEQDLAAALQRAAREGRHVLVDFETTWCGPCKLMGEIVYTAQPVVDAAQGTVAVKVDGDDHRDLTKRYAVGAYPTMLLLAPDGTEVRRAVGYRGVAEMVEFLRH